MIRRVTIEALAPTGEGVARTEDGVGFVAGALPGEDVEAEVAELRKRFWKGRAVAVRNPSGERAGGAHAGGCAGCDWAHVDLAAARRRKPLLFLETMERIGEIPPQEFGSPEIVASPPGYRLRARFHGEGEGAAARLGFYVPRTHRVEPADACLALSEELRGLLPRVGNAIGASGARVASLETLETPDGSRRIARAVLRAGADRRDAHALAAAIAPLFDGLDVVDSGAAVLARERATRLAMPVLGRELFAAPGVFFQSNRYLLEPLARDVASAAAAFPPGRALDLFGGVGLFAGGLLDAGHRVTTVEGDHAAVELAEAARGAARGGWSVVRSGALPFLAREREPWDVAVVDPPRAGLGLRLCPALAARVAKRLIYVSCEPATLARDLAALRSRGFAIQSVRLFDLFAFTHRVEALVVLDRAARGGTMKE